MKNMLCNQVTQLPTTFLQIALQKHSISILHVTLMTFLHVCLSVYLWKNCIYFFKLPYLLLQSNVVGSNNRKRTNSWYLPKYNHGMCL